MSPRETTARARKKMVILSSYLPGETYGLLGPQLAATIISEHTPYDCSVLAVTREDDKSVLKRALAHHFGHQRPVIGFSTLSGRGDLFSLARELTAEGAFTLLAGPQAEVDFRGEVDWHMYPHRFRGLSTHFSAALQGPVEQAIGLFQRLDENDWHQTPGLLFRDPDGSHIVQHPRHAWDERYLDHVRWDNLYRLSEGTLVPLNIKTAQVLQHIGCPHAARAVDIDLDLPTVLDTPAGRPIRLTVKGCSFCDVAVDKGFHGALAMDTVLSQVRHLPPDAEGRRIPFELINENPLPSLPRLLARVAEEGLRLSQVNLIMRADWLVQGAERLREALRRAGEQGIRLLLSSVGFESFDDRILKNLNKGLTVATNLEALRLMRRLKREFPDQWAYAREDGAIHGFIHPTPWDTPATEQRIAAFIDRYRLSWDVLPPHSVPLIIHHASPLGEWIRAVEAQAAVQFPRIDSIIAWWQVGDRFLL